jgi:opacity protein-like surface antigen
MNIKNLTVAAALLTAAINITSTASAADIPVKARGPVYDPCGVARFTGFYVGGNVGAAATTSHRNDLDGFFTDNSGWTATDITPTIGAQIGYDWQSCHAVFGIVADWSWINAETTVLDNPDNSPGQFHSNDMHWFATIRARAGLAVNDTLFYVTAGVAGARIETTFTNPPVNVVSSDTRWGIAAGAGAEFALWNNWSVNAEVLYLNFGKDRVTIPGTPASSFDLQDSAWVARLGLNYRFDNPRAAYAADMPVKGAAPVYPCGPSRFNGGYVGGNIGGVSYRASRSDLDGFLTDNSGWTANKSAFAGGAQIGWDWQSCNRLLGVAADWSWTNPKADTFDNPNAPDGEQSFRSKMDWFSTIRGRAGLVVDDSLIYVTGGVAIADIKTTVTNVNIPGSFAFDKTRWGLVAGVGAEFALSGGWSVNTELLYMQFSKQSVAFAAGGEIYNFDLNDSAWVSRIGLNYRWDNATSAYAAAGPVRSAPAVARFNGFYVGANVGGLSYRADRSDLDGFLTDNSGWTATDTAFTAGAQIGYDWQFGAKVLGVVADWNWTNARATTVDNPNAATSGFIRSEMDWFATLRTRSGVVVDNTLVYITGGLAAARIETAISETTGPFTLDKTRWGWTGGAGAEFALWNNWSATAEVLYMQFRQKTFTFQSGGAQFAFDNNDDAWVARVGLNYRWGVVGKAPVVAKF